MQEIAVLALHGFLGQASDWESIKTRIPNIEWYTPDLFKPNSYQLNSFLSVLDQLIHNYIEKLNAHKSRVFMGYSLGGRIGLHFLKYRPQLFDHYVFISAHPGLLSENEKELRLKNDNEWANKVKNLNWDDFLFEWNSQPVFSKDLIEPVRSQSDYSIESLIESLTYLSLGKQDGLREYIKKNQDKITWIVGNKDQKFFYLADEMKQKKILLDYKRISSGHRVLFENPKEVISVLSQLVS